MRETADCPDGIESDRGTEGMRLGRRIIAVLLCMFSVLSALGCFEAGNRAGPASDTENAARTESDYQIKDHENSRRPVPAAISYL